MTTATPEVLTWHRQQWKLQPSGLSYWVSHTIPSYPVGIPCDTVQPKSKPNSKSPHPQCHHTSWGQATCQGWHLTSLLLTLIICNNHFCTTPSKIYTTSAKNWIQPQRSHWKNDDHACPSYEPLQKLREIPWLGASAKSMDITLTTYLALKTKIWSYNKSSVSQFPLDPPQVFPGFAATFRQLVERWQKAEKLM